MSQTRAMLCALLGFLSWVGTDVIIKWSGQEHVSPLVIMAIVGCVSVLGIVGLVGVRGQWARLRPQNRGKQAIVSALFFVAYYSTIVALNHLPLTVFYILVFTSPLLIALLTVLLKHEVFSWLKAVCLFLGFIGVVIAVGLGGAGQGDLLGYTAIALCSLTFACGAVLMQRIAKTDTVESMQLITAIPVAVCGVAGAVLGGDMPPPAVFALIALAGVFSLLGNMLYNTALKHTSSTNVAQLHYTQIVSGAIFGYFFWHEIPTWNLLCGSALIVGAGIAVAAQAHKNGVEA